MVFSAVLLFLVLVSSAFAQSDAPRFATPFVDDDPAVQQSTGGVAGQTTDAATAQRASIATPESDSSSASSHPIAAAPATPPVGGGMALPAAIVAPSAAGDHEHWGPMLAQSAEFLAIQHAGNLEMDPYMRWNLTHGKWFHKWSLAVENWRWTRWNDDDPFLDDYIGHPIMGGITNYIWIQNDPVGSRLTYENSRAYWHSRLRATLWSAVYSAQWKIGPLSEASIGNTGSEPLWSKTQHKMTNGTGMVDWVMTPVGGAAWNIAEDMLDRWVIARVQRNHGSPAMMFLVSWLNPCRSAANILRFKAPWYREYRNKDVLAMTAGNN
jgi:hypothetical protein